MKNFLRILQQGLTDENGQGDIAYLAIGALTMTAIASLIFIFTMSTVSYTKCQPVTTISKGDQSVTSVIPCNFDPLPVGQAAGLVFGAFAALIGSLAGYMAATRKQRPAQQGDQTVIARNIGQVQQPLPQPVIDVPPLPVPVKQRACKKPKRR